MSSRLYCFFYQSLHYARHKWVLKIKNAISEFPPLDIKVIMIIINSCYNKEYSDKDGECLIFYKSTRQTSQVLERKEVELRNEVATITR